MTRRERITSILNGEPIDRPAWTTLVDDATLSILPEDVRPITTLEFYRHIGCDVLQFGNHGLPPSLRVSSPCELRTPGVETHQEKAADGTVTRTQKTPWGTLTAKVRGGHPVKYPITTPEELATLTEIWFNSTYEEVEGHEKAFARLDEAIGEAGIYAQTIGPSPVQQLIQSDIGLENFYYFLQDHTERMEGLIAAIHAKRRVEYEIVALRTPADVIIPVENTSSNLTSPAIYERYTLPHIAAYVEICHRRGKKAVLHMCGRLAALLDVIARTGLDGINALTPPPTGDVTVEDGLDRLGEDIVILGGVFDESVFQRPGVTRAEIHRALDTLYTRRVRASNLLLWLVADGLPTPVDRFLAVRDWMERNG